MKDTMAYCPKCEQKRWFEVKKELRECPECKKKYTIKELLDYSQNVKLHG